VFDSDGRPLHVIWRYSRAELLADAAVHVTGLVLAAIGVTILLALELGSGEPAEIASVAIYSAGLLGLLGISAAYNIWPVSPMKWWLRRFDHALIFLLIAATYTPFMSRMPLGATSLALGIGVWIAALAGATVKVLLPGRFDRLSIALYLVLGFSGVFAWDTVSASLPASTLSLMIAGGIVYAAGIVFHVWQSLRFQNAVWHGFVLVASALFYGAVLDGVVLA